jgi:hypothetical protein
MAIEESIAVSRLEVVASRSNTDGDAQDSNSSSEAILARLPSGWAQPGSHYAQPGSPCSKRLDLPS